MSILVPVLEQTPSTRTPWEQVKYGFVDWDHVTTLRLDGRCGVWLDGTRTGESHRLATTASSQEAIFFLLNVFDKIAECSEAGGSWIVGHDGATVGSISAARFPASGGDRRSI